MAEDTNIASLSPGAFTPTAPSATTITTTKRKRRSTRTPYYERSNKKARKSIAQDPKGQVNVTLGTTPQSTPAAQRRNRPVAQIQAINASVKGFGDLPPEVRNIIYDFAMSLPDRPVRITSGTFVMGQQLGLGLLGTCKAVRKEALGWYLGHQNGFRVDIVKLSKNTRKEGPLAYFTDCYDSRKKAYEKPMNQFLDCTKTTYGINKSHGLKSIKSLTLSFFHEDPPNYKDGDVLPEVADLSIKWSFLPRSPYFSLEVVPELSAETDANRIAAALAEIDGTVRNMVENRSVREFAAEDVRVACDKVYYSCLNKRIGEGVQR